MGKLVTLAVLVVEFVVDRVDDFRRGYADGMKEYGSYLDRMDRDV